MANDTRVNRYAKNKTVVKKEVPIKKTNKKVTKKTVKKTPKKKKHIKIRYRNVFIALVIFLIFILIFYYISSLPITNIYIEGNTYYSDQEIIEMASLSNYPSSISVFPTKIKNKLKKEELISDVKVTKIFRKVTIKITENKPLYYYESIDKTILEDGSESSNTFIVPTVINYIPDTVYDTFYDKMKDVSRDVLERISEIKYDPDEVDDGRFLLSMNDRNYVYLTLTKWDNINSYVNIIKEFPNQKGILYLNAGNSFEVME